MTINEVVSVLQKEKLNNLPSRFPCRAIMVKTVEQYCQLLSELKKISDIRVVKSSEIFSSADVMPQYSNLTSATYHDDWVKYKIASMDFLASIKYLANSHFSISYPSTSPTIL